MSNEPIENNPEKKYSLYFDKNKKKIITFFLSIVVILCLVGIFNSYKKKQEIKISENFNKAIIHIENKNLEIAKEDLNAIVMSKHQFYSPLSLNLIIDNKLEKNIEIIKLFDELINSNIEQEKIDLIRIKKALFVMDEEFKDDKGKTKEEIILQTLKPIIKTDSIWKRSSLKILRDFYLISDQKNKAKEFENLLINIPK
tara:strand:- start:2953 stop:3549 length:597 start_codon:yes stop_codon:yes gene_type:complete